MFGVRVRRADSRDSNFIVNATYLSAKFAFERSGRRGVCRWANRAFLSNNCNVAVVDVDGQEELLGFVIFSNEGELVWLYVKHVFRRSGIASQLLQSAKVTSYSITPAKKYAQHMLERRGIRRVCSIKFDEKYNYRERNF